MGPTRTLRMVCSARNATLPLPNVLHPKDGKIKSLRHYIFPPGNINHAKTVFAGCGNTCSRVHNPHPPQPTPTSPFTTLGDKQTVALRKIVEIFTKAASPLVTPPPRVHTPEKTPDAALAPPQRVDPHGDITFQPGCAPR